ncbi:MAG: hypothetical protein KIT68_10235, partial [Phycisphaeraceae bacterium]|nr:hypothetical protein [Phycisphaeraceae bacterium]
MKPLVLGLNSIHPDSAAVLANENGIIAAIAEERINRKKHCAVFPKHAIQEVLKIAGADARDITDISIARDAKANLNAKLAFIAKNPWVGFNVAKTRLSLHREAKDTGSEMAEALGFDPVERKINFHSVEHHLAHIASAYFCSGYERATGVSVDGAGDFCTVMIARCEGNQIKVLKRCHPPHSLGVYYTALCGFLGFTRYGEEYKVMGMAAYGQDRYAEQFKDVVRWDPKKGVVLNLDYFTNYTQVYDRTDMAGQRVTEGEIVVAQMWSDEKLAPLLGAARKRGTPLTQRDYDMACSLQKRFETVYMDMVRDAIAQAGTRDVVMAGGCALNGVANGRMVMEGLVDKIYIHPAAGDDGTAAGAALYVLHCKHDVPRTPQMDRAYLGTSWTDEQIAKDVQAADSNLKFTKMPREELLRTAVGALTRGKIMGWFQGREEWGPRALGNRSILCHPGWPDMKAILNARIKNREPFRPFAPACLHERLSDLYEGSHEVPFMNIVYKTKPEWRERLSATNHEDNTGRVQTVKRSQNEMYYDLIKAFDQQTGTPVLLNTSFNENEPIVHTPAHAIACFARTKMDCL